MIATAVPPTRDRELLDAMSVDLVDELVDALACFNGEDSLKEIFWSILSYDQQRLSLATTDLRPDIVRVLSCLELFAIHERIGIVRAECVDELNQRQVELLCSKLESSFPTTIVLLHSLDTGEWKCVYPDRARKHHLRFLELPGSDAELRVSAKALASLTAIDWDTDESVQHLEITNRMDVFFPGEMPRQRWEFDPSLEKTQYADSYLRRRAAPIADFYHDISSFPLLTEQQERGEDYSEPVDLDEGMNEYRWRLVVHNLRLVINIALKFPTNVLDLEDIVQEGIVGLITAARKFDPIRGNRFSTYAWYWIRQRIFRALQINQNLIRWPVHRLDELLPANANGMTNGLTLGERSVSRLNKDDLESDVFAEYPDQDPGELSELRHAVISTIRNRLSERQQRIMSMRFGLDGSPEMTLEEVGHAEGVTRERIRQIQEKAVGLLKQTLPLWVRKEFEDDNEVGQEA